MASEKSSFFTPLYHCRGDFKIQREDAHHILDEKPGKHLVKKKTILH